MKISLRWLNEYLLPMGGGVSAEEAEKVLTFAGFPIESATKLPDGDACIDVEVTSNRGDVLSHIGVAREVAASFNRKLKLPAPDAAFNWFDVPLPSAARPSAPDLGKPHKAAEGSATPQSIDSLISIDNRVPDSCPLFTARIITGAKVGPSPKWLVAALESIGQRSINNVVDITNFVAAEYGQPSHVFDLDTIAKSADGKRTLTIRTAAKGESLLTLDDKKLQFLGDEIIIASEPEGASPGRPGRPVSLAGVMGGQETGVTTATTSILLEAATWDPLAVRRVSRRFNLRTEASYRFERTVDPRTIEPAAIRLAALISRLTGGTLAPGVINAGPPLKPLAVVKMRPQRCRDILGLIVTTPDIQRVLEAHEIHVHPELIGASGGEPILACTIPAHRPDLEREIDLIEEVARTSGGGGGGGLDKLPVHESITVRVAPPQPSEKAVQEVGRVLTGLGFYETVTFTFISPKMAKPFLPAGLSPLQVCDERRKADPILRPSALPSILACRRANQDRAVKPDGDVGGAGFRFFELSAAFAESNPGKALETLNLSLLADASFPTGAKSAEQKQSAIRLIRGSVESIARTLGGESTRIDIIPSDKPPCPAYDPAAFAEVRINNKPAGCIGLIAQSVQSDFGLETPQAFAELNLTALVALFPPKSLVHALPAFPSIERDLSLIVPEQTAWARVESLLAGLKVPLLESWSFVGAYRGQQAGPGRKSLTLRMRFRDPQRTLKHEEVSPQVDSVIAAAKRDLAAEIRTA